jgi:hypothetical protein
MRSRKGDLLLAPKAQASEFPATEAPRRQRKLERRGFNSKVEQLKLYISQRRVKRSHSSHAVPFNRRVSFQNSVNQRLKQKCSVRMCFANTSLLSRQAGFCFWGDCTGYDFMANGTFTGNKASNPEQTNQLRDRSRRIGQNNNRCCRLHW